MKNFSVIKLDKRFRGSNNWMYCINRPRMYAAQENKSIFLKWREWCWSTWGSSKELFEYDHTDLFNEANSSNPHWCWSNDLFNSRIYFKSDREVTEFTLYWL